MALKTASFLLLMLLASAQDGGKNAPPSSPDPRCPATVPTDLKYRNQYLQTLLWPDGTIVFEPNGPGRVLRDGSLMMKFGWIRYVNGALSIHGRRLDSSAPELRSAVYDGYGESGFQPSALIFPTVGCWEVTGSVAGHDLTFVTRVVTKD